MLIEHNGLVEGTIIPVTEDFLLNLDRVAEITFDHFDQDETHACADQSSILIPQDTRVIHFWMSYPYARGKDQASHNQRAYYKLYFPPDCPGEYEVLRIHIDRQVFNI